MPLQMLLDIFLAKPDSTGNAIRMADFGYPSDQAMRRALRHEFHLQISANALALQALAEFVVMRHQQGARTQFIKPFQDIF